MRRLFVILLAAIVLAPLSAQRAKWSRFRATTPAPSWSSPAPASFITCLGNGQAIRYPVGVGRAGMAWHGRAFVAKKYLHPAWSEDPGVTPTIPGGSPRNPMGAAVLGLDRGNYAIHGTNNPRSIGGFVSHGCIRMYNADIMDLYERVPVGAKVAVVP